MSNQDEWFDKLYKENAPRMIKLATYLLRNEQVAADLVDEAFLILLYKRDKLEHHPNLPGWLSQTLKDNWDISSTFFAYPPEIRKIIYTTNIIEGLNRQFRQVTKNKPSFTNDDSLRKLLYLASKNIVERWTQRCRNWDVVLNQLNIMFEDRIAG